MRARAHPRLAMLTAAEKGRRRAEKRENSLRPLQIAGWGLEVEKFNTAWTPSGNLGDKSIFRWLLSGALKPCCVCYRECGSKLFTFMALLVPRIFWGADGGKQAALLGVFSSKIIGNRGDMEGLEYREENCSPEPSEI